MKHLVQELNINLKDSLSLWVDVEIDGETVHSEQGHSFTTNFLAALYSFMSGEEIPFAYRGYTLSNDTDDWRTAAPTTLVSFARVEVPASSGIFRTVLTGDDSSWGNTPTVYVHGIDPVAAGGGVAGRWFLEETSPGFGSWYMKDVDTGDYLDVVDVASIDTATYTTTARVTGNFYSSARVDQDTFSVPQLAIGYGTANNTERQSNLESEVGIFSVGTNPGTVSVGAVSISTPTIGSGKSIIEIEQSFTNLNGSVAISVSEVGMFMKMVGSVENNRDFTLMARDVITPVSLGASQVLTLKYRIIVQVDTVTGNGGILAVFNEILYRQIAQTSREAKGIFNDNQTTGESKGTFMVAGCGGDNQWSPVVGSTDNQYLGPQLGHSTKVVANTDFRLQYAGGDTVYDGSLAIEGQDSRYAHGRNTYQMQCFGPLVHGWTTSGGVSPYAQFQVDNLFHNLSGGTLTVNEMGFYVARKEEMTFISEAYAICRNRLTSPVTVLDGEIVKATYIFRVNL